MKVLLDHCVDIRFAQQIERHEIIATKALGWEQLSNGKLLAAAFDAGFDAFLTTDKNLRFQQNVSRSGLVIVTLDSRFTAVEDLSPLAPQVQSLLDSHPETGTSYVISTADG